MHIRRAFTQRAGFVLCRSPSALFPRALFPWAPLVARKKRSFFRRQVGFEPAVGPSGGAISNTVLVIFPNQNPDGRDPGSQRLSLVISGASGPSWSAGARIQPC